MKTVALLAATIFFVRFQCMSQEHNGYEEFYSHTPCFYCNHPRDVQLPDSLSLKSKNQFLKLDFYCYYDSAGNVIEIDPSALFVMSSQKKTDSLYYFFLKRDDSTQTITPNKAFQYAEWAKKFLQTCIKFKRYPPSSKCTQRYTNRNEYNLDINLM